MLRASLIQFANTSSGAVICLHNPLFEEMLDVILMLWEAEKCSIVFKEEMTEIQVS